MSICDMCMNAQWEDDKFIECYRTKWDEEIEEGMDCQYYNGLD